MPILTKKEFATKAGLTTGNLHNYILRGNVVVNENEGFDTEDERNALFLKKRAAKGKTAPPPAKKQAKTPKKEPKPTGKVIEPAQLAAMVEDSRNYEDDYDEESTDLGRTFDPEEADFSKLEAEYKRRQIAKITKEAEKLDLMNAKTRGETIPSVLIQPLFLQHNQSIMTEFKNAGDDLLRRLCKKHGIAQTELAGMRGELATSINSAMKKATAVSVKAVAGIISQHIDRRGVGERN